MPLQLPVREIENVASGTIGAVLSAAVLGIRQAIQSRSTVDVAKVEAEAKKELPVVETALRLAERERDRHDEDTRELMKRTEQYYDCKAELAAQRERLDGLEIRFNLLVDQHARLEQEHANCPGKSRNTPFPSNRPPALVETFNE